MPLPFVSPPELERIAARFLSEHHSSGEIPIPIEEIVEFSLGMEIVPLNRLYKDFGIDGWLSNDLSRIYVDEYQMEVYETRFRFTLTHEVAHRLLHADLYRGASFNTVEGWLNWYETMDGESVDRYEWQARNLAGRILVPTSSLVDEARAALKDAQSNLPSNIDPELLWEFAAIPVSRAFNVNHNVVFYRLAGDGVGKIVRPGTAKE